jgi:hypothetical protein
MSLFTRLFCCCVKDPYGIIGNHLDPESCVYGQPISTDGKSILYERPSEGPIYNGSPLNIYVMMHPIYSTNVRLFIK